MSEKKSTGISKILRELKVNGSPLPEFETDSERTYMITTFKIHREFNSKEVQNENDSFQKQSDSPQKQADSPQKECDSSQKQVDSPQKEYRSLSKYLSGILSEKNYNKIKMIAEYLDEHKEITPKMACNITKKSKATVSRYFAMLMELECIEKVGNTRKLVYRKVYRKPEITVPKSSPKCYDR